VDEPREERGGQGNGARACNAFLEPCLKQVQGLAPCSQDHELGLLLDDRTPASLRATTPHSPLAAGLRLPLPDPPATATPRNAPQ
jgi:hypothetical protein